MTFYRLVFETEVNAQILRDAIETVLSAMDNSDLAVIESTLCKVVLKSGLICGEPETDAVARSDGTIEVRADALSCFQYACSLLAHELRHIWQFGTGMATVNEPTCAEVLRFRSKLHIAVLERDADDFAKSLGFPRDKSQLEIIQRAWPHFSKDQKNAFVRRANEIRLQKRDFGDGKGNV